jgi:DNA repair protein RadC
MRCGVRCASGAVPAERRCQVSARKVTLKTYRCMLVAEGTAQYTRETVEDAGGAIEVLFDKMAGLCCEEIHVLYLNGRNRIVGHEVVARGGLHGCAVTARDVLRGALLANASAFILAHNHPSGDPTPSAEDREMTRKIGALSRDLGCPLLDHIVVCPEECRSASIGDGQ